MVFFLVNPEKIYNRNFNLNVLSLKHINLATKQDQEVELDYWAKLFKAKTWEELKMIAAKNDELGNIAKELYKSNSDWLVQEECRRREEAIIRENRIKREMEEMTEQLAEQDKQLAEQDKQLAEQDKQLAELNKQIAELKKQIEELQNK